MVMEGAPWHYGDALVCTIRYGVDKKVHLRLTVKTQINNVYLLSVTV